jgi:hypothetical protein
MMALLGVLLLGVVLLVRGLFPETTPGTTQHTGEEKTGATVQM